MGLAFFICYALIAGAYVVLGLYESIGVLTLDPESRISWATFSRDWLIGSALLLATVSTRKTGLALVATIALSCLVGALVVNFKRIGANPGWLCAVVFSYVQWLILIGATRLILHIDNLTEMRRQSLIRDVRNGAERSNL